MSFPNYWLVLNYLVVFYESRLMRGFQRIGFDSLRIISGLSLLLIFINAAALACAFVQNFQSSVFDINARTQGDSVYDIASHFTIEAFSCALREYAPMQGSGSVVYICMEGVCRQNACVPMNFIAGTVE